MESVAFIISVCICLLVLGSFDKYIPSQQLQKINELEELRKLDNRTIEDLQERLRKNGLDDSIG